MGIYNSICFTNSKGEECEIQFKNAGEVDPINMEVGSNITTPNGVHFGHEGCFVVYNGLIVAAFDKNDDPLLTKWGNIIPFPDLSDCNPLAAAVKMMTKEQNDERSVATKPPKERDDDKQKA